MKIKCVGSLSPVQRYFLDTCKETPTASTTKEKHTILSDSMN